MFHFYDLLLSLVVVAPVVLMFKLLEITQNEKSSSSKSNSSRFIITDLAIVTIVFYGTYW